MGRVLNIRQEIENSLTLWLPSGINLSDEGTLKYEFERVTDLNQQVQLIAGGEIDSDYFLDYLESKDVNMDSYVKVACENLEHVLNL